MTIRISRWTLLHVVSCTVQCERDRDRYDESEKVWYHWSTVCTFTYICLVLWHMSHSVIFNWWVKVIWDCTLLDFLVMKYQSWTSVLAICIIILIKFLFCDSPTNWTKSVITYIRHSWWINHIHNRSICLISTQYNTAAKWSYSTVQCISMHIHGHSLIEEFQRDAGSILCTVIHCFCSSSLHYLSRIWDKSWHCLQTITNSDCYNYIQIKYQK